VNLRPATIDDVQPLVAIDAASRPDEPLDRVVERYHLGDELGVASVRTDNGQRNAAMLHINEEFGCTPLPAFADYEKEL
jgi:hypothetical protein